MGEGKEGGKMAMAAEGTWGGGECVIQGREEPEGAGGGSTGRAQSGRR